MLLLLITHLAHVLNIESVKRNKNKSTDTCYVYKCTLVISLGVESSVCHTRTRGKNPVVIPFRMISHNGLNVSFYFQFLNCGPLIFQCNLLTSLKCKVVFSLCLCWSLYWPFLCPLQLPGVPQQKSHRCYITNVIM